jgi:hypothetical protein
MAKDTTKESRLEVEWAYFAAKIRLDSGSSDCPAVAKTEKTSLFFDFIRGVPHLIVEDESFRKPMAVPWTNVASVGWVEKP